MHYLGIGSVTYEALQGCYGMQHTGVFERDIGRETRADAEEAVCGPRGSENIKNLGP